MNTDRIPMKICLQLDTLEILDHLTDEQAGQLLRAIRAYHNKASFDLPQILQIAFTPFKNQFDRDQERYEKVCERNRINGAKGGRPEKDILKTTGGDLIPVDTNGQHFIYVIYDNIENQYKIGETQNLIQRRYDIKRPTNDLDIVRFWLTSKSNAIEIERDIIDLYKQVRVSGDWFEFSEIQITEVVNYVSQKTHSVSKYPSKAGNHKDVNLKSTPSSKVKNQVPYKKIVELYHESLPALPKIEKLTKTRENQIRILWNDDLPALTNWENYFDYVSQSEFLMGKVAPINGGRSFRATLEWLTKQANYVKVLEGNYHGV